MPEPGTTQFALRLDDVTLACYDFGGLGSPLLLIHGLAGAAHEWRALAKLLTASHRVFAFDQRGHGFSAKTPGKYSRDAYVRDAIRIIERLLSLGPLVLVGQSMGGLNATLVAARRPELVRGLVIIEAAPARCPTIAQEIRDLLDKWPSHFRTREEALTFFGGDSRYARAWVEGLEESDGFRARFRKEDMVESIADLAVHDYWDDWDRIACPTLVVVGTRGSTGSGVLDEMTRRKPWIHLERVENAGHDVHLDQPEAVGKAVQRFVSRLEPTMRESFDHGIILRPITENDSIDELTTLLHRAYQILANMGFNYTACEQPPEVTKRRIERGECYVATIDDLIVGTVTIYKPGKRTRCDWYNRPDTAHFGQFAVEPALQGRGIGSRLLKHIENRAQTLGLSELALDTAEGATQLVSYYSAQGYRIVGRVRWDGKSYESLVMSKTLRLRRRRQRHNAGSHN